MRIGFVLQDPRRPPTGLDTYTRELWNALRSLESRHEFLPVTLPMEIAGRAMTRTLWEQLYLPRWASRHDIDVLHVPAGAAPIARDRPCVLTLHDLGHDRSGGSSSSLGPRLYFAHVVPWSARFASALMTDSASTKWDAVARLGIPAERITVAPLAPGPAFRKLSPAVVAAARRKYGLADRYFLQVGALIPRKNVRGALRAFARVAGRGGGADLQLVFAGRGAPSVRAEAKELAAQGHVRFLGHVPEEDLVALYNGALAVVLPSFYEGFGLPLVEGFACGTPAIASRVASIPEVAGDAALYVDPHDVETITEAMERCATEPELRAEMAERALERSGQFSWRRTAEVTMAAYESAAGRVAMASPNGRPVDVGAKSGPKVLFVRLDSLGDLVLTTPCFRAIKRRYPDARVDVVVQPSAAPLAESDPHVDRVFMLDAPWRGRWRRGAVRAVLAVLQQLRRQRYDYVIIPRRDLDDAVFARLCGGRRTMGFFAQRTRSLLTDSLPYAAERHIVENHLRLTALLGCDADGLLPAVHCTSGDMEHIEALLGQGSDARMLVGVAPFASSERKTLSSGRAAALIDALWQTVGASIVLLGGPGDRARADMVLGRTTAPVVDLVGGTDLPELCDVLRRCHLLVCVDSGPMHLAAALGVPTVALFGGEDPVTWGPYGAAAHRGLQSLDARGRPSVDAIPVEAVLAAVGDVLGESGAVGEAERLEVA